MKAGVSKNEFIGVYSELLQMTREGIADLTLYDDDIVIVTYQNGYKVAINIAANSGMAIIRDIARRIG